MRSLSELQTVMMGAILSGDATPLTNEITAPNSEGLRRFSIYRNNTFLSLIRHLKAVFPVTTRLSDERFFNYAAFEFIQSYPPREPRLSTYGRGFPRFLTQFPACRAAPILPAIASLEWAIQAALTACEKPALPPTALAEMNLPSFRLVLQPSLQLVLSRWPVLPLLQGTHAEERPLDRRITYLAVLRAGNSIRFIDLPSARYAFWRSIAGGAQLDYAATRALARDPMFSLVDEILVLFSTKLVIATDNSHAH